MQFAECEPNAVELFGSTRYPLLLFPTISGIAPRLLVLGQDCLAPSRQLAGRVIVTGSANVPQLS